MEHIIAIRTDDDGTPLAYNTVSKSQWVTVDGNRHINLVAATAADVDAAIARLREQLEEEDRQKEERDAARPRPTPRAASTSPSPRWGFGTPWKSG